MYKRQVLLESDCSYWYESGGAGDLLIEGNVFEKCIYTDRPWGDKVIYTVPRAFMEKNKYYHRKDVYKRQLYDEGIVSGRSETVYAPADNVTRSEFVKMVVLAFNISDNGGRIPFTDVSEDGWDREYISACLLYTSFLQKQR